MVVFVKYLLQHCVMVCETVWSSSFSAMMTNSWLLSALILLNGFYACVGSSIPATTSSYASKAAALYEAAVEKGCKDRGHAYDAVTQKCWAVGIPGPCGDNMEFSRTNNNCNIGECVCQTSPWNQCGQPLVSFSEPSRNCFYYFSQGLCKDGEWLVPKYKYGTATPQCEKNVCLGKPNNFTQAFINPNPHPQFHFAYQGDCYVAGTQAFCSGGQVAVFFGGSTIPGCYPEEDKDNPLCPTASLSVAYSPFTGKRSSCPEGYDEDSAGECAALS